MPPKGGSERSELTPCNYYKITYALTYSEYYVCTGSLTLRGQAKAEAVSKTG